MTAAPRPARLVVAFGPTASPGAARRDTGGAGGAGLP